MAKCDELYSIPDRHDGTNMTKARELTSDDLGRVTDPCTRMSLRLQVDRDRGS